MHLGHAVELGPAVAAKSSQQQRLRGPREDVSRAQALRNRSTLQGTSYRAPRAWLSATTDSIRTASGSEAFKQVISKPTLADSTGRNGRHGFTLGRNAARVVSPLCTSRCPLGAPAPLSYPGPCWEPRDIGSAGAVHLWRWVCSSPIPEGIMRDRAVACQTIRGSFSVRSRAVGRDLNAPGQTTTA